MGAANENDPRELNLAVADILARMTPAEQAEAVEEARAKGVSVEILFLRAFQQMAEQEERAMEAFLRSPRG